MTTYIINVIFHLIFCIMLINLILGIICSYKLLNDIACYIYKYKINNFFLTTAIAFLYIFTFFILFYYIRLLNIGQKLDLKLLYNNVISAWSTLITPLDLMIKIPLISLSFLLLVNICILFLFLLKKATLEIYKLYIYILLKPLKPSLDHWRTRITNYLCSFWDSDIFSFTLHHIIKVISLKYKDKNKYPEKSSYFLKDINNILVYNRLYNNKYRIFVQISPVFF